MMRGKVFYFLFFNAALFFQTNAQQSVSIGDTQTKTNAVLYLKGSGTQGLIIPVVTTNGTFGESGMMVFNSTDKTLYYHNGTTWVATGTTAPTISLTPGQNISITGSSPNFTISAPNVDAIVGNEVTQVNSTRGGLEITGTGTAASPLSVGIIQGTVDGQILKWNNTTKKWELGTAGNGTVTSVALAMPSIFSVTGSPVTAAGTLTATLVSQTAGTVLAAPAAAAGVPSFRALTATDIPNLDAAKITTGSFGVARGGTGLTTLPTNGQLLIGNGTGYALSTLTAGTGINITNGAGTISIGSTGLANPMTAQGDIIFGGASGAATRLAGSAGFLKSTGAFAPTWSAVNLAATDVTGILPLTNGGTGAATAAAARTNLGLGTLSTFNAVSTNEITDGTIMDIDVNVAASIAGTKINPDFGGQNIVTTGYIGLSNAFPAYPIDITTSINGYGLNHTDGAVVLSTYTGNGGVYGGAIGTQSDHPFFIYTNNGGARLTVLNNTGNVGIGTTAPTTKLEVSGFTKLGSDNVSASNYSPAFKIRKITMTSSAAQGGCSSAPIGITAGKIVGVQVMLEYSSTVYIHPGYTFNAGYEYNWVINPSDNFQICLVAGNSASVLSKPVIIIITYEE